MPKPRGREHTTLTETAAIVVTELKKLPGIKMIAPGEIKPASRRSGARRLTASFTTAGLELQVTGQSAQRISVHTPHPTLIYQHLKNAKSLKDFAFKSRERKPGI